MRTAVYCATRNIYADMLPAVKSLLRNSNVEQVYFLTGLLCQLVRYVKNYLTFSAAGFTDEDEILLLFHQLFESLICFIKKSHRISPHLQKIAVPYNGAA